MITYIRNHFHPLWHLRQWSWFRRLQALIDFPVFKTIGKFKVALYWLRDISLLIVLDDLEKITGDRFEVMLTEFKPTCFLDIGANVGLYSWRVANRTKEVEIWMFEPDEKNVRLLKRTIARNGITQATLHAVAVSDESGDFPFLVDDVSGATGSLENQSDNSWSLHRAYGMKATRTVPCIVLDSFVEKLMGQRVLIKIDVEGAEDRVLRGAQRLLREVRPLILIECFEPQKLGWLPEVSYFIRDLKEGHNYLLYPQELEVSIANVATES